MLPSHPCEPCEPCEYPDPPLDTNELHQAEPNQRLLCMINASETTKKRKQNANDMLGYD